MFGQPSQTDGCRVGGVGGPPPTLNSIAVVNQVAHGTRAHIGQPPSHRHNPWPDGEAADGRGSNPLEDAAEPRAGRSGGTTSGTVSGGDDGRVAAFFRDPVRGRVCE